MNKQLEDILVRNKDMESLLQHLNTRYSIAYVVNLRADTQRPVVVPGYVQKMLDKHGGSFHEMLLDYCDKLVAPAYRDGFRMLFDYDYVRDRICREGAIRYAYVRNDGERFLITIFPDTHSVDEVMWVFAMQLRDETRARRDLWARAGEGTLRGQFLAQLKQKYDAAGSDRDRETIVMAARWGLAALDHDEEGVTL